MDDANASSGSASEPDPTLTGADKGIVSAESPTAPDDVEAAPKNAGLDTTGVLAFSGLDRQGQFRIGDRISIQVEGDHILLRHTSGGKTQAVGEDALASYLEDKYFPVDVAED